MRSLPARNDALLLQALGVADPALQDLYASLVATGSLRRTAEALQLDARRARAKVADLTDVGLVHVDGDVVTPATPTEVLGVRLAEQATALGEVTRELEALADVALTAQSTLVSRRSSDAAGEDAALDGELSTDSPVEVLLDWLQHTEGEMLWLRPDQWSLPAEDTMAGPVADAIRRGRDCRAIYPARALEVAPDVLFARAEAGEQIRIAAQVPMRLAVIGPNVLMPELFTVNTGRRVVLRERALVAAVVSLFDALWDRAVVVPGAVSDRPAARSDRRLLLQQLAAGARDEQIAATLGVGVRTVRRRVAELMSELRVETRFQAGMEAVRRGWL